MWTSAFTEPPSPLSAFVRIRPDPPSPLGADVLYGWPLSHLERSVDFGSVLRKKNRGFSTVRFSFYYAAAVSGYGAGRGGDKISQMMGGGWARSVGGGGLSR